MLQGGISVALDKLLQLEKQQRLAEDVTGTKLCCAAILDILYEAKEWKLLNEHILLLAKRRSQLKQVLFAYALLLLVKATWVREQALAWHVPVSYS